MAEAFLAEVRIMAFGYAPRNWAQCNGALVSISQATALFSLLGTAYGGNGTTTFGLPSLLGGRAAIGAGAGPGLTQRDRGETGGAAGVALTNGEMPTHNHAMMASAQNADVSSPSPNTALGRSVGQKAYAPPGTTPLTPLDAQAVGMAPGGGAPHNNLMPFQVLNYCICMQGIFPPRS